MSRSRTARGPGRGASIRSLSRRARGGARKLLRRARSRLRGRRSEGVGAFAARLAASGLFDPEFYLAVNDDVRAANADPFEHFVHQGRTEGRWPSARFDVARYVETELGGNRRIDPVEHFLDRCAGRGASPGAELEALFPSAPLDLAASIKHFANPGPGFEEPMEDDPAAGIAPEARARAIAFYLPQFHAFEQNDRWWGKGFTEWRNVARGTPRFVGHYQPRIPRDLGFYDLSDARVMHEQARLAARAGIDSFCFYHYWFDGQRIMDGPVERFLEERVDIDFCIMYANENWTRTWDGFERDVLIEQTYRTEDEPGFIADTARYMGHERYTRVAGRPLFILYRPGLLPEARETLARWRRLWTEALGVEPWILMVQGFGDADPREYGLDGAVEFPPHKLVADLPDVNASLTLLDPSHTGHVRDYDAVIARSLDEPAPAFPLVKTVSPSWDNDARREGRGLTLHGATPERYGRWLGGAVERAREHPFAGEPLVFVNAWNEWAEGAYLEPDVHYGHAWLNATRRAVYGLETARHGAGRRERLLLVGHDAYLHGAQMLLLNLAAAFTRQFGVEVVILVKAGGPLVERYREIAPTFVLDELGGPEAIAGLVERESLDIAICNTSVTGDLTEPLARAGVRTVSLIHELPRLVEEYGLEEHLRCVSRHASHVIFPAPIVEEGFRRFAPGGRAKALLRPQGTYTPVDFDAGARARCREALGIPADARVVLNSGYADLRKGFDLFVQAAHRMVRAHADVHFVWVGSLAPDMERWVRGRDAGAAAGRIHFTGFVENMAEWYSAGDALYLSSREDPYPTVALEAMDAGLPVIVHGGATGLDAVAARHGRIVDADDALAVDAAIRACVDDDDAEARAARIAHVEEHCRFDDYAFSLLELLRPGTRRVSVVVPNYDYEAYLPARMASIFDQGAPVFEVIVLDDASPDDSVGAIERAASAANRRVRLVRNETNGGNVFAQWRRGAALARGEFVWIAEADDLANERFLARSLAACGPDTLMSFTDSVQIGTEGERLAASYDYYYRTVDGALFERDFSLEGPEFVRRVLAERNVILNVSAVLWRRDALESALGNVGAGLARMRLVGDWRLYLEALGLPGARIAYVAEALNTHRRHASSVTGSLDVARHLEEIEAMHAHARLAFGTDAGLDVRVSAYVAELREQFGLGAAPAPAANDDDVNRAA